METGHINNIAAFRTMRDQAQALGASYSPSNPDLTLPALTDLLDTADTAQTSILQILTDAKPVINARQAIFPPLNKLVTRTLRYYNSTRAIPQAKTDAKALCDRFKGQKLNPRNLPNGTPDPDHVSNAHLGYIQKTETFASLLQFYQTDPLYAPTGPTAADITIAALTALLASMKSANEACSVAIAPIGPIRIERNRALYAPDSGIYYIQLLVKEYARGAYGATSPTAKLFTSLKFTNLR